MKATQVLKSVAAITSIAIFLAGCSGSDPQSMPQGSTITTTPSTLLPSTSPVINSSTTPIGTTDTDALNQAVDGLKDAANKVTKDASKAASYSKSTYNLLKWGLIIGGIALLVTGFINAKKNHDAQQEAIDAQNRLLKAQGKPPTTESASWMSALGNGIFLRDDGAKFTAKAASYDGAAEAIEKSKSVQAALNTKITTSTRDIRGDTKLIAGGVYDTAGMVNEIGTVQQVQGIEHINIMDQQVKTKNTTAEILHNTNGLDKTSANSANLKLASYEKTYKDGLTRDFADVDAAVKVAQAPTTPTVDKVKKLDEANTKLTMVIRSNLNRPFGLNRDEIASFEKRYTDTDKAINDTMAKVLPAFLAEQHAEQEKALAEFRATMNGDGKPEADDDSEVKGANGENADQRAAAAPKKQ